METIISACISAGVALIVCIIQQNRTLALLDYKIGELQKHVDKHNNLIERTYKLEQESAVHDEQIKVANHRIDDLEEAVKNEH